MLDWESLIMSILDSLLAVLASVLGVAVARVGRRIPLDGAGGGLSFMISLLGVVSLDVDMCVFCI